MGLLPVTTILAAISLLLVGVMRHRLLYAWHWKAVRR
jgi:hypothetical protein